MSPDRGLVPLAGRAALGGGSHTRKAVPDCHICQRRLGGAADSVHGAPGGCGDQAYNPSDAGAYDFDGVLLWLLRLRLL